MPDQLLELNSLVKNRADVWINPDIDNEFGYSDGDDEEQYLVQILKSVSDLSVNSTELASAIVDWASQYHLSASRSNLLKCINLPDNSKILELGCGCGAITRYLAEQGHQVTAVEGSVKRAEIARLRNRDLGNVDIITHNFNSLQLPEQNYDAVLFIGVLEYAKRFSDKNEISAEQAVVELLNKAGTALSDKGLIIIAIENRTGLKYKQGALEDHLAIPDVGLDNYKNYEFTGIKTYDYLQWQELLSQSDLQSKFYFPFPDYKLPNLIINNQISHQDSNYLSTQIESYDPISDWIMPGAESTLWRDINVADELNENTNSFGIVAAKSENSLVNILTGDWCLFDSTNIKTQHRVDMRTFDQEKVSNNNKINRFFNKENDFEIPLKDYWKEQFNSSPNLNTIGQLANEFYQLTANSLHSNILVDFDQVLLNSDHNKFKYAKYWQLNREVSPSQQLFHVLLQFCFHSRKLLSKASGLNFISMAEVISSCFGQAGLNYINSQDELIKFQQDFHDEVLIGENPVEQQLLTLLSNHDQFKFGYINCELFFSKKADQFSNTDSKTRRQKQTGETTKIMFENLNADSPYLRFDPCDHLHGNQHYFALLGIDVVDQENSILSNIDLITNIRLHDLEVVDSSKIIYRVSGIDPQIIFSLPEHLKNTTASYNLAVSIQWLGA